MLALLAVALSARVARAEEPATPFEAHVRGERGHAAARDRTSAIRAACGRKRGLRPSAPATRFAR